MTKILLAEDDADFANILKQYLEISGFEVWWCPNGAAALELCGTRNFDLALLDVMMPKMDGFTLAEQLVAQHPQLPFIFLTARQLKQDKLKGLKLGADDYIVKPFEADELVLRITNILRRSASKHSTAAPAVALGRFVFDGSRLELRLDGHVQQLTEKEAALLAFLHQNANTVLRRDDILQAVWHNTDYFSGRSMDVFLSRLRKYLSADENLAIVSLRNVGLEFRMGTPS